VDARHNRFAVVQGLTPETTYEFTVKARDLYGPNVSAPSNALTVTTDAAGGADTEPPSTPTNLHGWDVGDGANEINLHWTASFDNQTPQASIVYEVYQNGVLDHTVADDRTILYANQVGENTFTVIAVDSAGNKSAPASTVILSQ
jgi:chitinase